MPAPIRKRVLFALFFLSGFCSLLYETIWLRQAELSFGAIAPVVSAVLSFFMFGTALGSWLGGAWCTRLVRRLKTSPLIVFVFCQLLIASGAFVVPQLFRLGQVALLRAGPLDSLPYFAGSMLALALAIIPATFCMGALFPVMAAYLHDAKGFRRMYLANVFGGMCGALLTSYMLIELNGIRGTLFIGMQLNVVVVLMTILLIRSGTEAPPSPASPPGLASLRESIPVGLILFMMSLGFTAMQASWIRLYTAVLGPNVYEFANLLVLALLGMGLGSWLYLRHTQNSRSYRVGFMSGVLFYASLLPAILSDPRFKLGSVGLFLGLVPMCAAIGYLTPLLVDHHSSGRPRRLGFAYGASVLGSVLGPLIASFALLPLLSERMAMLVLSLAFVFGLKRKWVGIAVVAVTAAALWGYQDLVVDGRGMHAPDPGSRIWRDYAATVVASDGKDYRGLYVNSIPVAALTPVSKFMVHLPFILHEGPVRSALILGFGTGTTFRSALSWGAKVVAVEPIASVPDAFSYFHRDAERVLANPNGRIVIDDPRRYLKRTSGLYDAIIVHPQPPLESAANGMVYSREFYDEAKRHLAPGGVLHQFYPYTEMRALQAIVKALLDSFPHVEAYRAVDNRGLHLIASMDALKLKLMTIQARMPELARADMAEWAPPNTSFNQILGAMLWRRQRATALLPEYDYIVVTDDRPYNEYFHLRRLRPYEWFSF